MRTIDEVLDLITHGLEVRKKVREMQAPELSSNVNAINACVIELTKQIDPSNSFPENLKDRMIESNITEMSTQINIIEDAISQILANQSPPGMAL